MPTLYLLCGKIGSGKSTLVHELASRPATLLISEDHWTSALFADQLKTIEDYGRLSARLRAAMAPHITDILRQDLSVVLDFPANTFGVVEYFRDAESVQVKGPGPHDLRAFEHSAAGGGVIGGITHFGFRLVRLQDIDSAVEQAQAAGGRLLRRGDFAPGYPFAYIADPDGYEIEIWYE